MTDTNIKHFKLVNDDEIICEVLEWPAEDDASMLVRSCLRIVLMEDFQKGVRFYAFRPWLSFNDDPSLMHVINAEHVMVQSTPTEELLKHYAKTIVSIKHQMETQTNKLDVPLDEMAEKLEGLDEEGFEEYINSLKFDGGDDSNIGNIIKFPDKSKLH